MNEPPNHALTNPAIALWLQSWRPVRRVANIGVLGVAPGLLNFS